MKTAGTPRASRLSFLIPPALVGAAVAILLPEPVSTDERLVQHLLSLAVQSSAALAAGLLAWSTARRYQRRDAEGFVWRGTSLGAFLWAAGLLLYATAQWSGRARPYPSNADIGFVAAVLIWVLALGGQYQLVRSLLTIRQRKFLFMGAMGVWAVFLATVLLPILVSPLDPLEKALDVFYPTFGALLLVLGLAPALVFRGGLVGYSWVAVALGMGCLAVGSLVYAQLTWFQLYSQTHPVNLLRVTGFAALAAGAVWQRRTIEAI